MKPFNVEDVVFSAQGACVLEASVDKPGNVGPSHDFADTGYEDFLLSGIAIGAVARKAVNFGINHSRGDRGMGALILSAVEEAYRRHRGKNTNLGLAMLLMPLSASAGMCIKNNSYTHDSLRRGVRALMKGSTAEDSIDLYRAVERSI
jgi:triphosphoribosyl-dephospho-CoA synthase